MIYRNIRSGVVGLFMLLTLNSCAAPMGAMIIQGLTFYIVAIGKQVAITTTGILAEKAVDFIINWVEGKGENAPSINILPLRNDPLKGYLNEEYLIEVNGVREGRSSFAKIPMKGHGLKFERVDVYSQWQPTIETQRIVREVTKIGCAQLSLTDLGYYVDKVDGKMGPNTRKALKIFQEKTSGLKVTEVLDEPTMKALLGDQFIQSGQ